VSVAGAREQVVQSVALGVLDPSLRLKNTRLATVTVKIAPALERLARNRPVRLRGLAATLQAQATPALVDVGVRAAHRVEPDDIVAYVDVSGLGVGEYSLTVRTETPPDVGVTHIDPVSVHVRIASGRN